MKVMGAICQVSDSFVNGTKTAKRTQNVGLQLSCQFLLMASISHSL